MTAAVGQVPGTLIDWAAGVIGIPSSVVAAQITMESGGDPSALSPTGAEGVAQFEPSTWSGEGCSGSPDNVNDAMKCYAKYMYQLLQQEHGSVRDALAAYNAGPGNLQAGYGYADSILGAAGQPSGLSGSGGTGNSGSATLTSKNQQQAAQSCLWGTGTLTAGSVLGFHIGPSGSLCFLSKSHGRALIGGLMLGAGMITGLAGAVILAASVFRHAGADKAVTSAVTAGRAVTPAAREERAVQRRERAVRQVERRQRLAKREQRAGITP